MATKEVDPTTTTAHDLEQSFAKVTGHAGGGVLAAPEEAEPGAPPSPERILEALLFVGGAPLTARRAGEIARGLTPELFTQTIDALNRRYRRQNRPYAIEPHGDGYVLRLRAGFKAAAAKLKGDLREARLSTAAIDVLALVAYRQPIGRDEIDSLRGAESGALIRQLVRRGLIHIDAQGEKKTKEALYQTTPRFLELFGLQSLDELPRTQDLQQM